MGLAGTLVALTASGGLLALSLGLALVGATSGAADVSLNSLAGRVEQVAGRPVITPAHATFSAVVVVATLSTGALGALGAPLLVPFGLVVLAAAATCVAVVRALGTRPDPGPGLSPSTQSPGPAAGHFAGAAGRDRCPGRAGLRQRERPPELERSLPRGRARRAPRPERARARPSSPVSSP